MNTLRSTLCNLMLCVASFGLSGGTITVRADLLTADGDFDAQSIGQAVGAPWGPVGGEHTVSAEAQSPYDNVYPDNGKGAHFPASAGNSYIVGMFADKAIPVSSTDLFYFNVDFRNNSADPGDYSIVITRDASGAARSVAFYVTGDTLYAESSDASGPIHEAILTLRTDTWYNLQVTLDLGAKTYSGQVASRTDSAVISSRPFVHADQIINCVYTDGGTSILPGATADHDLDNWALSTAPLPALSAAAFVKSTSPSGSAVSPNAIVIVELQDNATRVNASSIQLSLNGQVVSPEITKPAGTNVTTVTWVPPAPLRPGTYTARILFADTAIPPGMTTNDFSFVVLGAQITSTTPVGPGITPDAVIQIGIADINTQVATNSIQLFLNGQVVLPGLTKPAGTNVTTVTYTPAGGFLPGSSNTVRIVFGDSSSPPVLTTNEFSFVVVDPAAAALIVNIDFNGYRNIPGPDNLGPTYSGQGAGGGGTVFNGIAVPSKLDDGTDDDNLTVEGSNLLNSIGGATSIGFTVSPVGGDAGGAAPTDPTSAAALFDDYFFNNSAGNTAGESPFTISGLGAVPWVDLCFYRPGGGVTVIIPGCATASYAGEGVFTSDNTMLFRRVPVSGGTVSGSFGNGTAVINGLSIVKPLPQPFVKSTSPLGTGVAASSSVTIELQDYVSQVATNSIQLFLNGVGVTSGISKPAGSDVTTITYDPPGDLPSESTNTVRVVFGDNSTPPIIQTYQFTFSVRSDAKAALIVNIDFNGYRNIPGPDDLGPTYSGQGAAGGGTVFNGIAVPSRLDDGTDEDNLTISGTNLLNSIGGVTSIGFTVTPVGGDVGGAPTTDPTSAAALFSDYFFNNSAGNMAGESPFVIDGLGSAPTVDIYVYLSNPLAGETIPGSTLTPFAASGIFTSKNTRLYKDVPVVDGKVNGSFGSGTAVINGLSIVKPLPRLVLNLSRQGATIVLSWSGTATLQSADQVVGPYADVGTANPRTISMSAAQKLYRLRQ